MVSKFDLMSYVVNDIYFFADNTAAAAGGLSLKTVLKISKMPVSELLIWIFLKDPDIM